jgi:hypothetical protein
LELVICFELRLEGFAKHASAARNIDLLHEVSLIATDQKLLGQWIQSHYFICQTGQGFDLRQMRIEWGSLNHRAATILINISDGQSIKPTPVKPSTWHAVRRRVRVRAKIPKFPCQIGR